MDMKKIDKRISTGDSTDSKGYKFYAANEACFDVYGIVYDENLKHFIRLPTHIADRVNSGVSAMNNHLAGGRIVFKSNTQNLAIKFDCPFQGKYFNPTMSIQAFIGFDVYERVDNKQILLKTLRPELDDLKSTVVLSFDIYGEKKEREFIIYTPLYSGAENLEIGIDKDCYIKNGNSYRNSKPVVFYGSSIVHGAAAHRPALAYPSIISYERNLHICNYGYSGSAKGEEVLADYFKDMPMELFVLDYDHNAPSPEHLRKTHERFYKIVREGHKDMPIIIVSAPQAYRSFNDEIDERFSIIKATYDNAVSRGENVYLINGQSFFDDFGGYHLCAADDSHPNSLGFYAMSRIIGQKIEDALKK